MNNVVQLPLNVFIPQNENVEVVNQIPPAQNPIANQQGEQINQLIVNRESYTYSSKITNDNPNLPSDVEEISDDEFRRYLESVKTLMAQKTFISAANLFKFIENALNKASNKSCMIRTAKEFVKLRDEQEDDKIVYLLGNDNDPDTRNENGRINPTAFNNKLQNLVT